MIHTQIKETSFENTEIIYLLKLLLQIISQEQIDVKMLSRLSGIVYEKIEYEMVEWDHYYDTQTILFYPNIQERKANKVTFCEVSSDKISIGMEYDAYRPMIYHTDTGKTYVLARTMRVLPCYRDLLPTDIDSFEQTQSLLEHSYEQNNDFYYNICRNRGGCGFDLLELKKKQKVKSILKK